jgi:secreted Zn-dependent insulinase-like peptidase
VFTQLRIFVLLSVFCLALHGHAMEKISPKCRTELTRLRAAREQNDSLRRRVLKLPNGLVTILFSDPKASKSAVALAVGSGSMQDPQGRPGSFHFLEHMVFINSNEYPEVDGYSRFVQGNGGTYNGMTGINYTVYPADIKPDRFSEALARLSAFFRDPMLSEQYIGKELNAVNQEYQNNKSKDSRRLWHITQKLIGLDHPLGRAFQGNSQTLADVRMTDLRELFDTHYVSGNLKLVLAGPQSLDELAALASQHFGPLPKRRFQQSLLPPLKLNSPGIIPVARVKSLTDRTLSLSFRLPHDGSEITSSNSQILGNAIKKLTPGGFAHHLIQEGLIETVYAMNEPLAESGDLFEIEFKLSPAGVEQWKKIVATTHSFLLQLSQQTLPEEFIASSKEIDTFDYVHDRSVLNFGFAIQQATLALSVPPEYTLETGHIPVNPSARKIQGRVRQMLDPSRWAIVISDPGFTGDLKSDHYGIEYSLSNLPIDSLLAADAKPTIFILPGKNPFFSNDRTPLKVTTAPSNELRAGSNLIYRPEDTFEQAKVGLRIEVITPPPQNAKEVGLLFLSKLLLSESLSANTQMAWAAGINAGSSTPNLVPMASNRMDFAAFGPRASLPLVLKEMGDAIRQLNVTPIRFSVRKESYLHKLETSDLQEASDQARFEWYLRVFYGLTTEQLVSALRDITFDEVVAKTKEWMRDSHANVLAHGELLSDEARTWSQDFLQNSLIAQSSSTAPELVKTPALSAGQVQRMTSTRRGGGGVVRVEAELGGTQEIEKWAAAKIFMTFIGPAFFKELRTEQEWGYSVGAAQKSTAQGLSLLFSIQSTKNLDAVETAMTNWINDHAIQDFGQISSGDFEDFRNAIIYELERPLSSIEESMGRQSYWFDLDLPDTVRGNLLASLKSLTKDRVIELMSQVLKDKVNGWRIFRVDHKLDVGLEQRGSAEAP